MNARKLYLRIVRSSLEVLWGTRSYVTLHLPKEALQEAPPPAFGVPAWTQPGVLETLDDGSQVRSTVFSWYGDEGLEISGTSIIVETGEEIEFLHPEVLEPMKARAVWEERGISALIPALREVLRDADMSSKTHYLREENGQVTLTFSVKAKYRDRVRRFSNSIRRACRMANRQGWILRVEV